MRTFEHLDKHFGLLPPSIVNALTHIDEGRGRQEAFRLQHPMVLETLQKVAMIQSVEASNAIEDIHIPSKRLKEIALDKSQPEGRSESEVAGYKRVLAEIHSNGENIEFTSNVVLQLHGWLFSYLPDRSGKFKIGENEVIEHHPDGTRVTRFRPVSAADTARYMQELHDIFDTERAVGTYHPLLLACAYIFDFLMIHPFQDGNGRLSRLITSLLLHQNDYEVGRYVSWEKLVNESRETYYEALQKSTKGWHEGEHDLRPWLSYFLGVLVASYKEFEARATDGRKSGRGIDIVESFVRSSLTDRFTVSDVRGVVPTMSDVQIGRILRELKEREVIDRRGAGRATYWVRLEG